MTIKELKKILQKYPDNMEILLEKYSDYRNLKKDDFEIVDAVEKDFYYMRSHPTMSIENKNKSKKYLLILGN